jgi:hypothetical protein
VTLTTSVVESTHTLVPCPVTVGEFVIDAGALLATSTVIVISGYEACAARTSFRVHLIVVSGWNLPAGTVSASAAARTLAVTHS